jgi:hypothetical protein
MELVILSLLGFFSIHSKNLISAFDSLGPVQTLAD